MQGKTYYIKSIRNELIVLIQRRNELAKMQRVLADGKRVQLPPILDNEVCERCYVSKICSTYAHAIEGGQDEVKLQTYHEMAKDLGDADKSYLKKWVEAI